MNVMKTKVLVATSLCAGKEYCLPFLPRVLQSLGGDCGYSYIALDGDDAPFSPVLQSPWINIEKLPTWDGPEDRSARLARMREATRQYFLAGDWTHLYWHDCDMIPPVDILPRLLAREGMRAQSGLYLLRGVEQPYAACKVPGAPYLGWLPTPTCFAVDGCGMGCMLVSRDLLEATPFCYTGAMGEDYQWCADAKYPVWVDTRLSAWHVASCGMANRLTLGEIADAVVWMGDPGYHQNDDAFFLRHEPHYDLDVERYQQHPGFLVTRTRRAAVEVKPVCEILT